MSFSQSSPTGYPTPPPSPGGQGFDPRRQRECEILPHSPNEWPSRTFISPFSEDSLPPALGDFTQEPESPIELTHPDLEQPRLLESATDINLCLKANYELHLLGNYPFRRRPVLQKHQAGSSSMSINSFRAPDRFVPVRSPLDVSLQRFYANKDPDQLSSAEKLLRHDLASADAFSHRRRATSPLPYTGPSATGQAPGGVRVAGPTAVTFRRDSTSTNGERRVSLGSTWAVGGIAPLSTGIPNGRGGLIGSGTNAPLYTTSFSIAFPKADDEREKHEGRLAKALELDRTQRVFELVNWTTSPQQISTGKRKYAEVESKTTWSGTEWVTDGSRRILDAPNLRDDFYCSVLAYSQTCHTLAVGLGTTLYAWSEKQGVHLLNAGTLNGSWLTSIAFSSTQGCKCILAYGRSDGILNLMSLYDRALPRFEVKQPCPIACLTWRPTTCLRPSRSSAMSGLLVKNEDLIVGDESGNIYYYSVEWPEAWEVDRNGWSGAMTLLARISIHTQQICGLAWSYDGELLATGGNDNLCCLFKVSRILEPQQDDTETQEEVFLGVDGPQQVQAIAGQGTVRLVVAGAEKHRWIHGAAVKAIAFCPWRDGLIATGGGSNDKCIHFYHAISGACLATISVAAQVTSLIWSTTRREIAATFGYAQPEHPYRIAVFSWPDCKQVAAIPWEGEHRALYAIPYPGGPNEGLKIQDGEAPISRTVQEGCIVVAASDESVKFHEVWGSGRKATAGGEGLLGGSDILEGLEGIDKRGEVIR